MANKQADQPKRERMCIALRHSGGFAITIEPGRTLREEYVAETYEEVKAALKHCVKDTPGPFRSCFDFAAAHEALMAKHCPLCKGGRGWRNTAKRR